MVNRRALGLGFELKRELDRYAPRPLKMDRENFTAALVPPSEVGGRRYTTITSLMVRK
jgi:hypothetical protein